MPKVSIIVPTYNVEQYLEECMESIINQTLTDIEIVCVDDGSTDNSGKILDNYAAHDSRIKVIHKENGGYGKAMNVGFDNTTGEYIGIVEPDDYIKPEMYETLYNTAIEYDADLIKSDYCRFQHKKDGSLNLFNEILDKTGEYYNKIIDLTENIIPYKFPMNTWAGIYKREYLLKNNIRHNETPGASYQDNGFWLQTFWHAKRAMFLNQIFYMNRRDNPNSSVKNPAKVFCMKEEYDYIYSLLIKEKTLKKNFLGIYHYKKYQNYIFTFNRIDIKFKKLFLKTFTKELKEAYAKREIDESLFSNKQLQEIHMIVKHPMKFYRKKLNRLSLMEKLFSLKNQNTHKILRVFGIKIKFKSNKLIEKKRITNIEKDLAKSKKNIKRLKNTISELNNKLEKPEISIILPVYNAGKYLAKCVDSIIKQTYENIEIICIDDGSTDNSLGILREYANNDSRFVLRTQENMGVGAARNRGLKIARGKYIGFIDDDDDFEPNMLEIMHQAFDKNTTDMACCAWNILNENKISKKDIKFTGNTKLNNEIRLGINVELWNKLFKKSIIDEFDIKFPNYSLGDDTSFTRQYLMVSQYVTGINKPLYNHYIRQDSITGILRHNQTRFMDSIMAQAYTLTYIQSLSENTQPKNYEFYLLKLKDYLHIYLKSTPPEQHIKILNKIKTEILDRIPNKYITDDEFTNIKNNNYNNYILSEIK